MHWATLADILEIVQVLIYNHWDWAPLHWATLADNLELVQVLLK